MAIDLKNVGKKVADGLAKNVIVTFKFKRGLSQKLTLQNPLKIQIDGKDTFEVKPDSSVVQEVKEGSHTLKLWLVSQDNEMGVVNSSVNFSSPSKYEVVYEYSTLGSSGKISVLMV